MNDLTAAKAPDKMVVAILQARMGSSRLPGKVLADIGGSPLLERIIRRTACARSIDHFVVATTRLQEDDPIEALARDLGVPCYRGEENDCLDRYYQIALQYGADFVVRLTGDNPLVDADFVDWIVDSFLRMSSDYDYASAGLSKTFPMGMSVEVFTFGALEVSWKEGLDTEAREHVNPFIQRHPERFRIWSPAFGEALYHLRWTVDTYDDLVFMRRIYERFEDDRFSWREVLALVQEHPELTQLNTDSAA